MDIELGMKVRIKDTCEINAGYTGVVESILYDRQEHNIGVDIDGDHENPTPFYYSITDLEVINLHEAPKFEIKSLNKQMKY